MKRPSHQCVFLGTFIIMVGVLKESRAQTICATTPVGVTKTSTSIEFQSQTNCSILNGSTALDASKASGLTPGAIYSFNLTCQNCSFQITTNPAAITNLTVIQSTTSSVSLKWVKPEGIVTYYKVSWTNGIFTGENNTSEISVNITGLTSGVQYRFTVTALAEDKVTAGDNTSISQYTQPAQVLDITSTQTTSSVFLNWTNPEGNRSFYRVKWINGSVNGSDIVNQTGTYYNITGLTPGVPYTFVVSAVAGDNVTEGQGTQYSVYTIPNPVADLFARHDSNTSVIVSWNKTLGWQTYYRYRVQTLNATSLINTFETVNSSTMVTDLSPGTLYNFNVTTVAAPGSESSPASTSSYTRPNAVTNLQGMNLNSTAIQLTWLQQADHKPTYSYVVEVNRSYNQSTATETYTFTGLDPGSPYSFRVFTVVEGVGSSEALTIAQTTPGMVTYLQTFVTTSNMTVTWRAPLGLVNSYSVQLYRGLHLEDNCTGLANSTYLVLFQGLRPGTLYVVKVLSLSGPLSNQANVSNATFPNPPGPINVTEQTTSSINITWSNPADMTPDQYNFTVSYGAQPIPISQNQSQLNGLLSGTAYNITVTTVGVLGYQSQVVMTTNFTKPLSVSGLTEAEISTTSVTLVWVHPGPAFSYLVETTNPNGTVFNSITVYNKTATIPGLQSGSNYSFAVTTQTDDGTKAIPVTVFYFTRPYAIRNLTTYAVNTTTIFLNWTRPEQYQSGYTYSVSTTGCVLAPGTAANRTVLSEMDYINGLTPGAYCSLTVSVKAMNGIESSAVHASQYTEPGMVQPIISRQSNSSLQVSWDVPPGNVEQYVVFLNDTSVVVYPNVTDYVFSNLLPGRLYKAIVSTEVGPFRVPSNYTINATYPNPPGPIIVLVKTTSSLSLEWTEAPLMGNVSYEYQVTQIPADGATRISAANNSVQLSDLLSGTPYNISVTTVGALFLQSQAVWAYLVTTRPHSVGSLMSIASDEHICLKWSPPSDPKPGYQYNVTWRSSYGNFSETTAASELIINNLVPGSPYNFTVTATTADGTQGAPVFTSNCTSKPTVL